jgi:tetratricopeptide (TPR) repeat protein
MPVKTEKELGEPLRNLWLKAVAAIELRNFDYAISLLQGVLKQEPEFLTGRQLLRRTEVTKHKGDRRALFNISTSAISIMKAQRELKNNPKRAVEMIEKVLEEEPYNRQANLVLKQAALAAGWPEIGVFALQTLLEEKARDTRILHELGRLYHELGESEREVEVYHRIIGIDPADAEADRLAKDASARASMKSGGWTRAESYRDLVKDKESAASPAPPGRSAIADEPVSNSPTTTLDREIVEHEAFLAGHGPEDESYAVRSEALLVAKKKRGELLIDDGRKRSERDPTDLQVRFELGEHLLGAGRFREALPELQRARQHPGARLKAMNLLGCCYRELGMFDLAAKQLEEAAQEIGSMDGMKKEIVYNLGLVLEQMGHADKSIACMKQIFEVDYGYRDVAVRVEKSYQKPASPA